MLIVEQLMEWAIGKATEVLGEILRIVAVTARSHT
jgi:hypothetical protein